MYIQLHYLWTFLDGEKESAGYKGMLQAPTQAFLAETEGGEITRKPWDQRTFYLSYIFVNSKKFLSKFSTWSLKKRIKHILISTLESYLYLY